MATDALARLLTQPAWSSNLCRLGFCAGDTCPQVGLSELSPHGPEYSYGLG